MDYLFDFITNPYLITGLAGWFWAQILKVIIHAVINKKIVWERLVGDGGMPSGHSATVTSLALYTGLVDGFGSHAFAVAGILAVIVCHDAMGVRRETGKQAVIINELVKAFEELAQNDHLPEERLKEFVGHTPVQVVAGVAIGIVNAIAMYWIVF